MAQLLNHAQPGQVITAELWNLVVDAVNELLQSGQTSGIKIAANSPAGTAADPLKIGSILQITGQNFGFSIGLSKVIFEGPSGQATVLRQNMLAGSSDERLVLLMPPIPGITAAGLTATMRVDNGLANDSRSVFVIPVIISLSGDMFVNWRSDIATNPNPNPLQTLQPGVFAYRLQSGTNLPAAFDLSADIINASVALPAGLISSIEFRDEGNNLIANKRVEMGKNEVRNIAVRIPLIPAVLAAQTFTLKITASAGGVVGTDAKSFTVGAVIPPADPGIDVQQTGSVVLDVVTQNPDPPNGSLEGSTIKLKPGKQMVLIFNVKLKTQGIYDISIVPKPGAALNGWTLQLANTPTPVTVAANNDDPQARVMQFIVTRLAGNFPNGAVIFRIKRQGVASEFSKEYGVELMP